MKDYQGFDLKLAIVDAIPVLEFGISILLISIHFQSVLFLMGVILCVIAGCGKVVWKLILALQHKNVELLTKQFRYTMPSGFLLIILSLVMNYKKVHIQWKYPSNILFILVFIGMIGMMVARKVLSQTSAKNNWFEQFLNIFVQTCLLIGIIVY